jgi:hypothetical protein
MRPWGPAGVGAEHDIGVQHLEQRLEVPFTRGGEEGVDDFTLTAEAGVGDRGLLLDAAGAAGELPCRGRRAFDDRGDLVEGDGEHVVQNER